MSEAVYTCSAGHVSLRTPCWCGAGLKITQQANEAAKDKRRVTMGRSGKYNARQVTIAGITFDSTGEAARFLQLCDMQNRGEIWNLLTQHPIAIRGENRKRIGLYNCDFFYRLHKVGDIYEDFKGTRTAVFSLKQKMLAAQGIEIKITTKADVPKCWFDLAISYREVPE